MSRPLDNGKRPAISRPWRTATWVALLTLATLLVSQTISFAVVWMLPSPQAPQMNLGEALQVMRGERSGNEVGLRRWQQPQPPEGTGNAWLTAVVAEQLQRPQSQVRAVWRQTVDPAAVQVQVIKQGRLLDAAQVVGAGAGLEPALLLPELRWPAFELAARQADGHWLVVGPDYSGLASWRRQVLWALLAGAVLLAPLAAWLALRLTRPLRQLADASTTLSLQSASSLPREGPREVQDLADAVNAARQRLRDQAGTVTRMLAAVAHDLRTPLTGLRLRADSAPPEQAARMVSDIERMTLMIDQVLDYARGELQPPQRQATDLGALLGDCAQHARARGIAIEIRCPIIATLDLDALLIRRAVDNLIDNAARYAGQVELSLRQEAGDIIIDVADRGPGIAEADKARLLQPFERHEASRNRDTGGVGLGLAVAQVAARRHGGEVQLLDRPGGGLIARLHWPARGSPGSS